MKATSLFALLLFAPLLKAKEWAFDVYLDKQKIGTHRFALNDNGALKSEAKFNVKVLFINAYTYEHTAQEQWQNNCLTDLTAHTIEKKQVYDVTGKKNNQSFEVTYQNDTQKLPACTMTFAYWNPNILTQTQLLNPQNAEYLNTKIEKIGQETIVVKGQNVSTTHYKINGALNGKTKLKIDLWYDSNNDWVALKSTTPEGYQINYKLK